MQTNLHRAECMTKLAIGTQAPQSGQRCLPSGVGKRTARSSSESKSEGSRAACKAEPGRACDTATAPPEATKARGASLHAAPFEKQDGLKSPDSPCHVTIIHRGIQLP